MGSGVELSEWELAISRAKFVLMREVPQLASIVLNFPIRPVTAPVALMTDKGVMGIGYKYTRECTPSQLAGLIWHEAQHFCLGHYARRNGRDPLKWNLMADAVINEGIRRLGKVKRIELPNGAVYPETLGLAWAGTAAIPTVEQAYSDWVGSEPPSSLADHTCGSGAGGVASPSEGELNGEALAPAEVEDLVLRIAMASAQVAAELRSHGVGSEEHQVWADSKVGAPKVDPFMVLRSRASRMLESARGRWVVSTWHRPNRRMDCLPGSKRLVPEVTVIADVSGSMCSTEVGNAVLTEVWGVIRTLGRVRVVTFDTEVTFDGVVTSPRSFLSAARGGGGTDVAAALLATDGSPRMCLTDGYMDTPRVRHADVLWVITPGGVRQPWMRSVVHLA